MAHGDIKRKIVMLEILDATDVENYGILQGNALVNKTGKQFNQQIGIGGRNLKGPTHCEIRFLRQEQDTRDIEKNTKKR